MFIPVERANKVAFSAPEAAPAAVRGVFYWGTFRLSPVHTQQCRSEPYLKYLRVHDVIQRG
jgi:hypothetical protein